MVDDSVDDCSRHLVVPEDRPPAGELQVRGDCDRLSLVGIGEYLEHEARPVRLAEGLGARQERQNERERVAHRFPVAPCPRQRRHAPDAIGRDLDVSRYGVIAGERVDTLEGFGGVADDEPGAVWRVSGLVEKPAAEEAPSNLYIVGRYLLSPLVMDLLADQEPGKGGEIQLTDAMARSLEREAMYAVVIDPLSGYDTGTPSGWIATNALMAASDPRFADEFWEAIDGRGGLVRR